jgi:type IV secretory pathway TrbF-like protein
VNQKSTVAYPPFSIFIQNAQRIDRSSAAPYLPAGRIWNHQKIGLIRQSACQPAALNLIAIQLRLPLGRSRNENYIPEFQ